MDKEPNKPFMVRLRPDTRQLLDKASEDQRRSRASIIDELIREAYQHRFGSVHVRLNKLLGGNQ